MFPVHLYQLIISLFSHCILSHHNTCVLIDFVKIFVILTLYFETNIIYCVYGKSSECFTTFVIGKDCLNFQHFDFYTGGTVTNVTRCSGKKSKLRCASEML